MPILFIILVSLVPFASAHPFTLDTIPAQSSNAPAGTSQVIIFYSEELEIEFSSLKVFDNNGNQIDNRDTSYYEDEKSLIVTTAPLEEGIYTVASKVLSKVDGHLVPSAFVFGIGDVTVSDIDVDNSELIFYPEAGARFPGLVGQTIILGAAIASIVIWGTQRKDFIKTELGNLEAAYKSKFFAIIGIGAITVLASNILMLIIQTLRLETSAIETLQTSFGMTWSVRMGITISLLVAWFVLERRKKLAIKSQILILAISLILVATTTMIGHGAASEQIGAIILDYVHNVVAAAWIGGVIFFAFALLPILSGLKEEYCEKMSLLLLPKFSIMIVIALGIVIISGPILMWFLESNVSTIVESTYGKLIIAKIIIAAIMIGIGGYHQFGTQRRAERNLGSKIRVHKKLRRTLKAEVVLGIALLGVVALLTNGTLPAGEIQSADAGGTDYGLVTVEFAESTKFYVDIFPFTSGVNSIKVMATDLQDGPISDLDGIKVKISNPEKNITPIEIEMTQSETGIFDGETTFGFSGNWLVEIEAQKTESISEAIALNLLVKPRLENLQTDITQYALPEQARPLYLIFDGKEAIWISDKLRPALWRFDIEEEKFEKIDLAGQSTQALAIDHDGKIWFTDIAEEKIGYYDPANRHIEIFAFPQMVPYTVKSTPIGLEVDKDNDIWVSIITKGVLLEYDQKAGNFEEYKLENQQGAPFDIIEDKDGTILYTESATGKIGTINPDTKENEYLPLEYLMASPEAFVFDKSGNLWITEHSGAAISKYNPILQTLEKIPVINSDSLPFGMAFDRYDNIWFAEHQIDSIGVYDPHNNDMKSIPVPSQASFVQYITSDNNGNIWFAEEGTGKIGIIKITEIPATVTQRQTETKILYTELASPLMALGIVATSLFFVKSIQDKRRLNEKVPNA